MHDSLFVRVSCLAFVPEVCLTSDKHGMSSQHDMKTRRTISCQLWTRNYGSANDQVRESSDVSPVKECLIVIRYVTQVGETTDDRRSYSMTNKSDVVYVYTHEYTVALYDDVMCMRHNQHELWSDTKQ